MIDTHITNVARGHRKTNAQTEQTQTGQTATEQTDTPQTEIEQTETLETKLGGPGYATEYRQLIIQEPDDDGKFSIEKSAYVSSNIKCAQVGMNSQPIYITSVSVRPKSF